jgi:molybdopterin-guanine dinucleotide biosynthesis protein A
VSGAAPVGVVLTGGGSTRMGADKAFVRIGGCPMVIKVADALWEAGCRTVVCQGGNVAELEALGLVAVDDVEPGSGPVAAIHAALSRIAAPIVVAACDLADLDAGAVRTVIAAGHRAPVAVAEAEGHRHLLSSWSPAALPALAAAIAAGESSYRGVLDLVGAVGVEVPSRSVRNVNRPSDVR